MDKNNSVQGLLGASMEKIKEMVDANTVIGTPINAADGTILIPVSRISYGFASGGSDYHADYKKGQDNPRDLGECGLTMEEFLSVPVFARLYRTGG